MNIEIVQVNTVKIKSSSFEDNHAKEYQIQRKSANLFGQQSKEGEFECRLPLQEKLGHREMATEILLALPEFDVLF